MRDLSLTFYEGEIFGLLGHNGAGKTTALHYLAGLVRATAGAASVFGLPLAEFRQTRRREVGFASSNIASFSRAYNVILGCG